MAAGADMQAGCDGAHGVFVGVGWWQGGGGGLATSTCKDAGCSCSFVYALQVFPGYCAVRVCEMSGF